MESLDFSFNKGNQEGFVVYNAENILISELSQDIKSFLSNKLNLDENLFDMLNSKISFLGTFYTNEYIENKRKELRERYSNTLPPNIREIPMTLLLISM